MVLHIYHTIFDLAENSMKLNEVYKCDYIDKQNKYHLHFATSTNISWYGFNPPLQNLWAHLWENSIPTKQ